MRTREEVIARFEEMRAKKLAERKAEFLSHHFRNCMHNIRLRVKNNGKMGFCRNPKVVTKIAQPIICDEEGTAERCKYFQCRNTEESIEQDFEDILRNPARCGECYPKMAMLLWFIQDYGRPGRLARMREAVKDMFRGLWNFATWRWW